jgi:hypothetical protein
MVAGPPPSGPIGGHAYITEDDHTDVAAIVGRSDRGIARESMGFY